MTTNSLSYSTIDTMDPVILCCGGCAVRCRMFNSISDLCLLDASKTPTPTAHAGIAKCSPGRNSFFVENHWLITCVSFALGPEL